MTKLPYNFDDTQVLKALIKANHKLGELNGAIKLLPNPYIIFNAITLGEAKESSEIENIVTTFDEIFKEMSYEKSNPASKEVLNYRQAMLRGYELVKDHGFISVNHIIELHHILEPETDHIRKLPRTRIINTKTGQVLHTPPHPPPRPPRMLQTGCCTILRRLLQQARAGNGCPVQQCFPVP